MSAKRLTFLAEAITAGAVGGMTVAVWFLVLDFARGRPLLTPSILGELILLGNPHPDVTRANMTAVGWYTVVHFLAFILLASLIALLVRQAGRQPLMRFALLVLFVTFEFLFVVVVNAPAPEIRALFPLWTVLGANLLASVAMGIYFWRRHPDFRAILRREPLGA